jgi:hypothetical protein
MASRQQSNGLNLQKGLDTFAGQMACLVLILINTCSRLPFSLWKPEIDPCARAVFYAESAWCAVPVRVPRQVIGVIKTTKTDFEEDQQETSPEFPRALQHFMRQGDTGSTTNTYHSIQQRWEWIQPFLASLRKLSAM